MSTIDAGRWQWDSSLNTKTSPPTSLRDPCNRLILVWHDYHASCFLQGVRPSADVRSIDETGNHDDTKQDNSGSATVRSDLNEQLVQWIRNSFKAGRSK